MKFHKKRLVSGIVFILIAIAFTGYVGTNATKTTDPLAKIFADIGLLIGMAIAGIFWLIGIFCFKSSLTWR